MRKCSIAFRYWLPFLSLSRSLWEYHWCLYSSTCGAKNFQLPISTYMALCILRCFIIDSVPQKPPTSLIHLKYFSLDYMSSFHRDGLYLLALLIRRSPNLEKIFIEGTMVGVWSFPRILKEKVVEAVVGAPQDPCNFDENL